MLLPTAKIAKQQGMTLLELIITLVVATVLLALGAPAVLEMTQNNRLVTERNKLVYNLHEARSKAITSGVTVHGCRSEDGLQCSASGEGDEVLFFVDDNDDGIEDATDGNNQYDEGANEELLGKRNFLPSGQSARMSVETTNIAFNSEGFPMRLDAGGTLIPTAITIRLNDDRFSAEHPDEGVKCITLQMSGHISNAEPTGDTSGCEGVPAI